MIDAVTGLRAEGGRLEAVRRRGRHVADEYQRDPRDLMRLALSESPFGPSPRATAAARAQLDALGHYPDSAAAHLTGALARFYGVATESVVVTSGSDEALLMAGLAFGERRVVCCDRTYGGHEACAVLAGAHAVTTPVDPTDGVDVDAVLAAMAGADLAYVCNPHNPVGRALAPGDVVRLVERSAQTGCVLVLDEAYMEFASPARTTSGVAHLQDGPVLVLRSFSKAYGLAGLRCGYALGAPALIDRLSELRHGVPFGVNRVALAAAEAALADQAHLAGVVARSIAVRDRLRDGLRALELGVGESETNFLFADVGGDAGAVAAHLRDRHGIHVKSCGSLGHPRHLRVGVCRPEDLDLVLGAVADAMACLEVRA